MKCPAGDNFAAQLPTQPDDVDKLSDLSMDVNVMYELKLLRDRIAILEKKVGISPQGHDQAAEIVDVHDDDSSYAHITIEHQQPGSIAIAISSPQSTPSTPRNIQKTIPRSPTAERQHASVHSSGSRTAAAPFVSSPHQLAMFGNALLPIPLVPSQPIQPVASGSTGTLSSSWGQMMTPKEVQALMAPQPQAGEYYVVIKGRRPGVYMSWPDAHELIDGLKSPCYWKRTDKHTAQGQYTVAYNKGSCEYRFQ